MFEADSIVPDTFVETSDRSPRDQTRIAIWQAEIELTTAALRSGWSVVSRNQGKGDGSAYIKLRRDGEMLLLRISDHVPPRPIGVEELPILVCIINTPGGLAIPRRHLTRKAVQVED